MSRGTKAAKKTGPEAAERLRALFAEWGREEAGEGIHRGEPLWEQLEEDRPDDGKPFPNH